MKYVSYLLGGLSAVAATGYFVVYLYRWEWQRALISGVLLLVVEIFLACMVLLGRLARLERRLTERDERAEDVRRRLEASREDRGADRFGWLRDVPRDGPGQRTFVFIPVLMAAGALLSFVAWAVQKLAAATARPGAQRRLAGRLTALTAPPPGGGDDLEDRDPVPRTRAGFRTAGVAVLVAAALIGLDVLVDGLADATQTRDAKRPASAATTVVFRVEARSGASAPAARDLWESCRRATRAGVGHGALGRLDGDVWAGVLRPALTDHDTMRLRGCLRDATANRARAVVLGDGQTD
ncbi:hypothetical protein [Streptomyces boninensis]|uniref:hypothetical protein n=1 Tax=Streptomyces boninensis TaxID=2039455 RepID=UPI003B224C82